MGTATDVSKLIGAMYDSACGAGDWPQLDSAGLSGQQWQELLPHLQRALCLQQRLREAQLASHCALAALDAMGAAVLVLDAGLGLRFATPAGHALHAAQLEPSVPPTLARAVRLVIASADGAQQCQSLRLARKQQAPLAMTVTPLADCQPACALMIAHDPTKTSTSVPALRQLFDLTQAEAQVGKALAQGATIEEIAARSGISVNTVKTHLHHTYLKTDTRRQGELIALIHGATAHLAVLDA
ncbi:MULTISPECIES: helix-turn-helix transcriptional regulator [unclassified Janthinobacterium]|uniref:helix-turn-helix transcriptional regulator n=1 Tax=unclassified Janthinobacterium TaxID=2610881 RepID=UPI000CC1582D|nr:MULTISPECIES: helix-turn-helix transcriptional regulator [unclassified Janthinobacterium]PKV43929.1 DNA-binding CsgD family transcriptional regulator [Janthinobacterium sp. 61]TDY35844.1 DNA-binding CsgD family transcriptional regulator [Janthinobacterium sp. 75]